MESNVTIMKQYIYILDRDISLNVFDCINNRTREREVYYIQKGGSEGVIQFNGSQAMYIAPKYLKKQQPGTSRPTPPAYQSILISNRKVTDEELGKLAQLLQTDWRKLIRNLGVNEDYCDKILRDNIKKTLTEKVFLCLQYWKTSAASATVGVLARGLESANLAQHITEALKE